MHLLVRLGMLHIRLTWHVTVETDLVGTSGNRQHSRHGCGTDGEGELGAERGEEETASEC